MEITSCSRFVAPRRAFARLVLCLGFVFAGVMPLAAAEEAGKRSYDIPAGNAADALKQFSEQSGRGVMANGDLVKGIRTNSVKGEHAPVDALELLLADTGLVAIPDTKSGAFSIRKETAIEAKNVSRAIVEKSGRPDRSGRTELDEKGEPVVQLDTFEVFGRKTLNMDIPRTEDGVRPYVVFDSGDIESSSASNLEDFFRTRLPMNSSLNDAGQPLANNQQFNTQNINNISSINLRGLGQGQTLILVDGRRHARTTNRGLDFMQPDINGIPLSSIERIEVLPSTAGGIYGGGATGGVINIILKRKYNSTDVRIIQEASFKGGAESSRVEFRTGFSTNKASTNFSIGGAVARTQPLFAADNNILLEGRRLYAENNNTNDLLTAYTTNIRSSTGTTLVFKNGSIPLNSDKTYIPVGFIGIVSGDPTSQIPIIANAGRHNVDLANDARGRRMRLRPGTNIKVLTANIRHEFASWFEVFGDFSLKENQSESEYVSLGAVNIAAGAAGNPFNQSITVTVPAVGLPVTPQQYDSTVFDAAGGFIARLANLWTINGDFSWSRSETYQVFIQSVLNGTAFNAAVSNGTVNVFRDLNIFPIDFTPFLSSFPSDFNNGPFVTRQRVFALRLAGPLWELPAGPVSIAALLESREEQIDLSIISSTSLNGGRSYTVYPDRKQSVLSGYTEFRVPLFSASQSKPLFSELELVASARYDRYRTRSSRSASNLSSLEPLPAFDFRQNIVESYNHVMALRWLPISDLALRVSYATGFLPPSVSQLNSFTNPIPSNSPLATDPRRNNEPIGTVQPYQTISSGNPDLMSEESSSYSLGAVWKPNFVPNLRISVDFTEIRKSNEINGPMHQFVMDNELNLPGRVLRSAGDSGAVGPVSQIDISLLNIARSRIAAWDLQADYVTKARAWGSLRLSAIVSRQTHLERQFFPTSPSFDTVGFFDGPLEWRGNAGLTWIFRGWQVAWNTQYYHSYSLDFANPSRAFTGTRNLLTQGGVSRIPSQSYHEFQIRYSFGEDQSGLFKGLLVNVGIQNVFGKHPPPVAGAFASSAGFSGYGDPRLRRFSLSVAKRFGR